MAVLVGTIVAACLMNEVADRGLLIIALAVWAGIEAVPAAYALREIDDHPILDYSLLDLPSGYPIQAELVPGLVL